MICPRYFRGMTKGLERWYGGHDLHFITCSCYQRRPELATCERRDLFLRVLERARQRHRFVMIGYVVMPEHFHLRHDRAGGGRSFRGDESRQRAFHKTAAPRRGPYGADLAKAVLRFQRLQFGETHREASVHASQSREARSCDSTRGLEMEQLQGVRLRRRGLGKGQLSRMALDHQLFRLAIPLIRKPRMSGAPGAAIIADEPLLTHREDITSP